MKTSMRATGPMHLLGAFYAAMAALALFGQSDGLMHWLGIGRAPALAVALAVELLAAVLFAFADWRRTHHGERAVAARLLSVAVALGVAVMNYRGHEGNGGQVALFTGASVAGYAVWVLHTEARRRDALRADSRMPAQPPVYGLALWFRSPGLVSRARQLAIADPTLGVHDSIAAASAEAASVTRNRAIAAALRRKLKAELDPLSADVAMASFDLDEVAARLSASVDYVRLTAILAADIDPDRIKPRAELPAAGRGDGPKRKALDSADVPADVSQVVRRRRPESKQPRRPAEVTRAMAEEKLAVPGATRTAVAKQLDITTRQLRRVLNEPSGELPVVELRLPTLDEVQAAFAARPSGEGRIDEWLADTFPVLRQLADTDDGVQFVERAMAAVRGQRINGHDVLAEVTA